MSKEFIVIDDYTSIAIWDELILEKILKLKSKSSGWKRSENTLPEGDWKLHYGFYSLATRSAYDNAGIKKPEPEQLPAIFCVDENGVKEKFNVTAEQAADFIRE